MSVFHVARAGQGECFQVVTDIGTIKASGEDTSGRIAVMEVVVPSGGGPPTLHRHPSAETFYVLEGTFEIRVADAELRLSRVCLEAGDTLAIPSLVWHNFRNIGAEPGKFLAIHGPAGMENAAREVGTPVEDPARPPRPTGPLSEERKREIIKVMGKYVESLPLDQMPE